VADVTFTDSVTKVTFTVGSSGPQMSDASLAAALGAGTAKATLDGTYGTVVALNAEVSRATTAEGLKLDKASNLSDVASAMTARANLGLGNVDNTSDANKPLSTAGSTALALKAPLASPTFTGTVSGVTKTHVGLANVDNTSDVNKPVSTAQATADALKVDKANYPLVGNPGDDLAALLSSAAAAGRDLILTAGTYTRTAGIYWDASRHSFLGSGEVILDFTGMSSGYAINAFATHDGGTSGFAAIKHTMSGMKIVGTRNDSTLVDGVFVGDNGDGTANASMIAFENIHVYGFRDQWFYGDVTWCISQIHCIAVGASRYSVNLDGLYNAGENYQFAHCSFANATNAGGTGICIYSNAAGNVDATFTSCSFDYSDILFDHNGGNLTFLGCHFENNHTNNPMGRIYAASGGFRTTVTVIGGQVSPTEAVASARPALFVVKAGSTDPAFLTF
jgi:hypothetical protein